MSDDLLACPRCRGRLLEAPDAWTCTRCGPVAARTLGFPDFLAGEPTLALAADGEMDLRLDEQLARALAEEYQARDLDGLRNLAGDLRRRQQEPPVGSSWHRRARARFHRHYARVNAEASGTGGEALLAKIDSKLAEAGWAPLGHGVAVEAGGGEGCYLPAFASRFERVVFVDASLANLVLASKLVDEQGLANVTLVRADVLRLPFADGSFDFVHQNGVVEHVPRPQLMVNEGVRVRRDDGHYVCVSPNRWAVTPEPHFGLPLFGLIPPPVRRALVPLARGIPEADGGTDPRALHHLRSFVRNVGHQEFVVFFLPRHLPFTARQTWARRLVRQALLTPGVGDAVDVALNRVLLALMPQHIVVVRNA